MSSNSDGLVESPRLGVFGSLYFIIFCVFFFSFYAPQSFGVLWQNFMFIHFMCFNFGNMDARWINVVRSTKRNIVVRSALEGNFLEKIS